MPCKGESGGRLEGGHATGIALLAVLADLVPPTTDRRLEDEVGHRRLANGVFLRPPAAELGRKHLKRALLGDGNRNRSAYHGIDVLGHRACPFVGVVLSFSAAMANAASALSHIWSR